MKSRIKISAFTLAEVLVTLSIIGIVAALTIPSLIKDSQTSYLRTSWRHEYSLLSQATQRIVTENGGSLQGLFASNHDIRDAYMTYLSHNKSCNWDQSCGVCWTNSCTSKYLNGTSLDMNYYAGTVLNNGTNLMFWFASADCTHDAPLNACGQIFVDVNGTKQPNTIGKDIYSVWILKDRIVPTGFQGDHYDLNTTCIDGNTTANNQGLTCSAKYLKE